MPNNRIIRMADLVEAVKRNEPEIRLFAHGRITAGDVAVDHYLPKMLAGPKGESWAQMYGVPDPRPEVMRKMLPVFEAIERNRAPSR